MIMPSVCSWATSCNVATMTFRRGGCEDQKRVLACINMQPARSRPACLPPLSHSFEGTGWSAQRSMLTQRQNTRGSACATTTCMTVARDCVQEADARGRGVRRWVPLMSCSYSCTLAPGSADWKTGGGLYMTPTAPERRLADEACAVVRALSRLRDKSDTATVAHGQAA